MQPVSVFLFQNRFRCLSFSLFCDLNSIKVGIYKGCVRCPVPQPPNMHEKMYSSCVALSYHCRQAVQCSYPSVNFFLIALNISTFQTLILDFNVEFD